MAIAGLHNVSVLDSSFIRDSQSQASRQLGDERSTSTRASSLLRLWRGIEDEQAVSGTQERFSERSTDLSRIDVTERQSTVHREGLENIGMDFNENDIETWSDGQTVSQTEDEDSGNFHDEHSREFGGSVERERVRQIFREWMNSGAGEHAPNVSQMNSSPRAEWLGETEQERVRNVREWVQKNTQQRGTHGNGEVQIAGVGVQVAQICDGLVGNPSVGRIQHARRGIRRLCGRQALLDMVKKAERERQREIEALLERQSVSGFAHRNRIQSLLKSRFLRNDRLTGSVRSVSVAESELGLLRQRPTVSGLREGFISKLDNSVHDQSSCQHSDTTSNSDLGDSLAEPNRTRSFEVLDDLHEHSGLNNLENHNEGPNSCDSSDGRSALGGNNVEGAEESVHMVESWREQIAESEIRDQTQGAEFMEMQDDSGQNVGRNLHETAANVLYHEPEIRDEHHTNVQAVEPFIQQVYHHDENDDLGLLDHSDSFHDNDLENVDLLESASHEELDQVRDLGDEPNGSQEYGVQHNGWENSNEEDTNGSQLESVANDWSGEFLSSEYGDVLQNIPEASHENGIFLEDVQNWLDVPSNQEATSSRRLETFYFPDDDNVHNVEIRELLNRRSVSNLLSSGFRESLDQLIQSYVERQGHSTNMDLEEMLPSYTSVEQELDRQSEGQAGSVESHSLALPLPPRLPSQQLWDQNLSNDNWSGRDFRQQFGVEWEIINDLRIDMSRLQQRMGNLQRMLEACMDMQLELQRSIKQEVSSALNRPAGSEGMFEDNLPDDEPKWDHVRKGICCICCESHIDALLYRCGHMCTCSICANELVENQGKCPMCRAPIVEVIRAYSL